MAVFDRVKKVFNAFRNSEPAFQTVDFIGGGTASFGSPSPSRPRYRYTNERSIIGSIYSRLSIDVAGVEFRHIKEDSEEMYVNDIESPLNTCLTLQPNLDQGPRAWRQDIALTLFDRGVAALVPVDTTLDTQTGALVDIFSLRVGQVVNWHPNHVRVSVYNEATGKREEIVLEKRLVALVENPFHSVMNEANSTLQRLRAKLDLLDVVDEQSSSGRLDLIIQLPYAVKSEKRQQQAEKRREDIEFQLRGSQYGIAYSDATEKITQLNRPAENNLLKQVENLTEMLYSQLGLTETVMNGTADEKTMINYFNRTVEPITDAIIEAMQRVFIGPVATADGEKIGYFYDRFKLVTVGELAEIGDKFIRNQIFTPNELRGFIGVKPSKNPKANELNNPNMPPTDTGPPADGTPTA